MGAPCCQRIKGETIQKEMTAPATALVCWASNFNVS